MKHQKSFWNLNVQINRGIGRMTEKDGYMSEYVAVFSM
jgi:hypothetical protein